MKYIVALFLCVAFPSVSFAQDAKMTPVTQNQATPYDGVLLSPEAVADIVASSVTHQDEVSAAVARATGEAQAQCRYSENEIRITLEADVKIVQAKLDSEKQQNKLLLDSLKKSEARQSNPLVWGAIGTVVGVGTTVLIVWALGSK